MNQVITGVGPPIAARRSKRGRVCCCGVLPLGICESWASWSNQISDRRINRFRSCEEIVEGICLYHAKAIEKAGGFLMVSCDGMVQIHHPINTVACGAKNEQGNLSPCGCLYQHRAGLV